MLSLASARSLSFAEQVDWQQRWRPVSAHSVPPNAKLCGVGGLRAAESGEPLCPPTSAAAALFALHFFQGGPCCPPFNTEATTAYPAPQGPTSPYSIDSRP